MGMSHDDDHATCTGHSHIMSGEWVKGRNPSDLSWSSCSRDDLENFLRCEMMLVTQIPVELCDGLTHQTVNMCQMETFLSQHFTAGRRLII